MQNKFRHDASTAGSIMDRKRRMLESHADWVMRLEEQNGIVEKQRELAEKQRELAEKQKQEEEAMWNEYEDEDFN